MKLTVTFREPEPGQLEDGECFAQPFYRLWGGAGQPLMDGIFDGVGLDARAAYEDAVQRIAGEQECYDDDNPAVIDAFDTAYDMAVHDLIFLPAGGPFVCHLHFAIS